MKKMTKGIVSAVLGTALAFTIGAGVYNVYESQSVITADAATYTIDMTDTIYSHDWGTCNDYKEAGLYRLFVGGDKTKSWGQLYPNEHGNTHYMDYIKINGKTLTEHRDEYSAKLANGETSLITWTGMPANDGCMQPNIANEIVNGLDVLYAPIFVNVCYHGSTYGNAIDMYIPNSYISEVTSIELLKDFTMTNGTDTWGISQDIKWVQNSYGGAKIMGEKNVIETSVTAISSYIDPNNDADRALGFFFSDFTLPQSGHAAVDKALLASLDYYDYILIDGVKLGSLMKHGGDVQREVYYNAWGLPFGTRWPEWMKNQGLVDSIQEITILAGCQFPKYGDADTVYQTTEDVTFIRQASGAFADPNSLMYAENFQIGWAMTDGDKDELFRVEITSDAWDLIPHHEEGQPSPDKYDFNYYDNTARDILRKSILLNGVSLYEINTTVDDSTYEYHTWPMTLDQKSHDDKYDVFANPTMLEVNGETLVLYIHKDYMKSICSNFGDTLTITILPEISASDKVMGKVLAENVVAEVYAIGYDVTLMNGNKEVDVLSVKAGNALSSLLPAAEAEHLTFAGWVDADGNPAPETMPAEVLTLYATWKPVPYTATIVHMDGSEETFVFGMMKDEENGVLYTAEEMAEVVKAALPEKTATEGYAFKERVPADFQLQDYTFTVETVQIVFTITFTDADGNDIGVASVTFTEETIETLVLPEVPAKEGYTGKWNKTVDRLRLEDITLYAVYTEVKEEKPVVPDSSTSSDDNTSEEDSATDNTASDESTVDSSDTVNDSASSSAGNAGLLAGCSGIVGGVAGGLTALGIAAVALLKKKED